jgi:hypothetical protein
LLLLRHRRPRTVAILNEVVLGGGEQAFWDDNSQCALRYALPLLYAATGTLTFADIIRFISTAPA